MQDQIFLKDYRQQIEIGAFNEERNKKQELKFDLVVSLKKQETTRDIADDILTYDVLIDSIDHCLSQKRYNLLETLAEDIANEVLKNETAEKIEITIEKLERVDGRLGVSITRSQKASVENKQASSQHMLVIYELGAEIPKIEGPKIFIPSYPDENPSTESGYHQRTLACDIQAWEIAERLKFPLIDTMVETRALMQRNESFVLGFGRQPFELRPEPADFSRLQLINWHKHHLNIKTVWEAKNK